MNNIINISDVHVQRWTNVLVRMELTQSISDQVCIMTKNTDTTIFTIIMGEVVKNIPDKRIMAVDKLVSSVVKFKINNVTYADTGQYSIVSQSDTKNFGGIRLIVTGIHSIINQFRIPLHTYIDLLTQFVFATSVTDPVSISNRYTYSVTNPFDISNRYTYIVLRTQLVFPTGIHSVSDPVGIPVHVYIGLRKQLVFHMYP